MTERTTLPVLIDERPDGFYWKIGDDPAIEFFGPYPTQETALAAVEDAIAGAYAGALNLSLFGVK
jgi:hypothetical protein